MCELMESNYTANHEFNNYFLNLIKIMIFETCGLHRLSLYSTFLF